MKISLLIIGLFLSVTTFGQNSFNDIDSNAAKIIETLKNHNQGTQSLAESITNRDSAYTHIKRDINGYRICDFKFLIIDSLEHLLTNKQVDALYNSDNGSLRLIGFILFIRKNNNKNSVVAKLNDILKEKSLTMITDGDCNHAIYTSTLGTFSSEIIMKSNTFFKPSFKLKKTERLRLKKDLATYNNRL